MVLCEKIQDIAIVLSGVYLKEIPMGEVNYLQIKDFDRGGGIIAPLVASLELNTRTEKHILSEGDLLFAAKGLFNFCAVFQEEWGNAVASSSFLVLKIKDKDAVLPEYLSWTLNRDDVRAAFQSMSAGSVMPSVTKSMMEELEINVPPIAIQKKMMEIYQLQCYATHLSKKILVLNNKLIEQKLITITKSTNYTNFFV